MHKKNLRMMILAALFAALTAVLAQVTIPLPLVPITGQTVAIGLIAIILGGRWGAVAVGIYLLMGLVGLPVFAQAKGGVAVLFGPTGGFLIGFVFKVYALGKILERTGYHYWIVLLAINVTTLLTMLIGTAWLKFAADLSWGQAFMTGYVPFIGVEFLKSIFIAYVGVTVRRRLMLFQLIPNP